MEYRTLGTTGLEVSTYCLGTMMFGSKANTDHDECVGMIYRALDAGINLVDTADIYSMGESETIVGKALAGRRDEVVLATKCHFPMGGGPNQGGNTRRWIHRAVEDSLRRLGTDWIDLYQIHRYDPSVDLAETLGALTDLVRRGLVRYVGCSTFPPHVLAESQAVSERRRLERFVTEQPPYSIFVRHVEADTFDVVQRYGMGTMVWSPLRGGWLTGKYRRGQTPPPDSRAIRIGRSSSERSASRHDIDRPEHAWKYDAVERLSTIADRAGMSLTHMSLNWTLHHPAVTTAIIGPRTPDQLGDLLAGADMRLDDATLDAIDQVVEPGTTPTRLDRGYVPPWLGTANRRRPLHGD